MKRDIKKAGNRKRRNVLKRDLANNPEEAAQTDADFEFCRRSSETLNGNDQDTTRRKKDGDEEE